MCGICISKINYSIKKFNQKDLLNEVNKAVLNSNLNEALDLLKKLKSNFFF